MNQSLSTILCFSLILWLVYSGCFIKATTTNALRPEHSLFKPPNVQTDSPAPISEKLAPELQALPPQHAQNDVNAVIQVNESEDQRLDSLLSENRVRVISHMPQLGILEVKLPAGSLETVARSDLVEHVSSNQEIRAFGHVSNTTGADSARGGVPGAGENPDSLDGSGVNIAVIDSGIDADHWSFRNADDNSRVIFSRDFTGENRTDDPYGHGTHVAAAAAGNGRIANNSYLGIAPNTKLINLRVLNAAGNGTIAGLLVGINC